MRGLGELLMRAETVFFIGHLIGGSTGTRRLMDSRDPCAMQDNNISIIRFIGLSSSRELPAPGKPAGGFRCEYTRLIFGAELGARMPENSIGHK